MVMSEYELRGRSWQSLADQAGNCGQDAFPIQVGADLVTAGIACPASGKAGPTEATVQYISFANIPVPHGCSCRVGGVSQGPFASLNVGYTTTDQDDLVDENCRRLGAAVGVPCYPLLFLDHGTEVVRFDRLPSQPCQGDACITDVPGMPLAITTADCVPLIMYDPRHRALGVVHAGWRGTVARIAHCTLRALYENYSTQPEEVQVAIGPSIGPCCFEVGEEVAEQFVQAFSPGRLLHKYADMLQKTQDLVNKGAKQDKYYVNLWLANLLALLEAGVVATNVRSCGLCSKCWRELFYSYRRDRRVTGRIATLAMLPLG